ncbi:MAG: hypothetical protein U0528_08895 [Anaerolineae bacterium]
MRPRLPRLLLLTTALLIACTGALTAVAARRSNDDNGYHCLQLLTTNDQRLLIDLRSGAQLRVRSGLHRAYTPLTNALTSPDGRYVANVTYSDLSRAFTTNVLMLWIDGADVSSQVLARLPLNLMLFKWASDHLLLAGGVVDQRLVVFTIDLSDPRVPKVSERHFPISAGFAGVAWVDSALLVVGDGVVDFWLPQRDAWVSYALPVQLSPAQLVLFPPPNGMTANAAALGYNKDGESGIFVLEPVMGIIGSLRYPAAELVEVRWSAAGTRLRTWLRRHDGTPDEISLWQITEGALIALLTEPVPATANGIHVTSADGSSYVYVDITTPDAPTIRLHRMGLDRAMEDTALLTDIAAVNFTPTNNALIVIVQRGDSYDALWIDGAGTITPLAQGAVRPPDFVQSQETLVGLWQTQQSETNSQLMVIDLRYTDAAPAASLLPVTINTSADEAATPTFIQSVRFGDMLVINETLFNQPITYYALNLRTGAPVALNPDHEPIRSVERSDRAPDYFRVLWDTRDGRSALTEFAPDGTRVATFLAPAGIQPATYNSSPDRLRTIIADGFAGDQYLLFPDGTWKSLPKQLQGAGSFQWTPDGTQIVGANINPSGIVTDAYLLDSDGNLLMHFPIRSALWSRTPLTRCS